MRCRRRWGSGGAHRAWASPSPLRSIPPKASGAAEMKNQLLGSFKGSSTPQRRGWAGMGATGHSGRLDIPTPDTQQPLLGAWVGLELPDPCARGQGIGCSILCGLASPSGSSSGRARLCWVTCRWHWGVQPHSKENKKGKQPTHQGLCQTL